MPNETCASCDAGLSAPDPYCPRCGRPTPYAGEDQILDWDLKLWRSHVDRAIAADVWNGGHADASVGQLRSYRPASSTATVETEPPATPARGAASPEPGAAEAIQFLPAKFLPAGREMPEPGGRHGWRAWLGLAKLRSEPDLVIDLDADGAAAGRACPSCNQTGWIVRTVQDRSGAWDFWCLRCSRAFRSDLRLRFGVLPFVGIAIVLGALAAIAVVLR